MLISSLKQEVEIVYRNFLNEIGFDGEDYPIDMDFKVAFAKLNNRQGKYLSPETKEVKDYLEVKSKKLSHSEVENIKDKGIIVLNKEYLDPVYEQTLVATLLHEFIHLNRTIITNKVQSSNSGIDPYIYCNGVFVENTNQESHIVDISEILWGNVDTSMIARKKAQQVIDINDFYFNKEYDNQLEFQDSVDEALTEIMSIAAYRIYLHNNENIMDSIRILQEHEDEDIRAIANIIIRHNDLDLFKWMINPLYYQDYDLNNNFFLKYINSDDIKDLKVLYKNDYGEIDKIKRRV